MTEAAGGSIGGGEIKDTDGGGAGGRGEGADGSVGMTGGSIGGGGGVRGRLPGPDLVAGVLGAGVLGSEFGTTLLMTLLIESYKLEMSSVHTVSFCKSLL